MKTQRDRIGWIIATWFGSGLLPKAPGTWGSVAAFPFAYIISAYAGFNLFIFATVALFFIGMWASGKVEKSAQKKDPGFIVVDEVVGQWVALFPVFFLNDIYNSDPSCFPSASIATAAFIAFRVFDIWKPWPITFVEKNITGGLGIMLDDVMAGIYALIITSSLVAGMILIFV